jgi:uncharacterized damage-inducible protein DinB
MKEILEKQFSVCYDENGWFVAVRNAIEGVTVEQAAWKPDGSDDNCIWETLSHITYYNNAYLQRFKGIEFEYDVSDNDQTFSTGEYSEADWQADIAKFDAVMNEFRELIRTADESKFTEPVPTNISRKWWEVIADINAHNAYHGGQVLLLRKLQGAWNPEKGVS